MPGPSNLRSEFITLVEFHDAGCGDEEAAQGIAARLSESRASFRVELEESTTWADGAGDGLCEYPTVSQCFKVFAGNEFVCEGWRNFGCEFEDSTHTGLGGRWDTIRIDDGRSAAEMALESIGIEIECPSVPPARLLG